MLVVSLAILSSLVATLAVSAPPSDPRRIAMVFPPWWSTEQSVTAAASAGDILGIGGVPFIVIVRPDPAKAARGARSAGALFTLGADPRSLCSSLSLDPKT